MKERFNKLQDLLDLGLVKLKDSKILTQVLNKFNYTLPKFLLNRILSSQSPALKAQFIPSPKEAKILAQELSDPIADAKHTKLRGIVHRYPDRCLLTPLFTCPVYCRFCFRKEQIGKAKGLSQAELELCYAYIKEHPEIWEVILTGGDPLSLKPKQLANIISELTQISHLEIIRLHTRVPILCPELVNAELIAALKLHRPVYVLVHINHIDEFSLEAEQAIAALVDAGIVLLSQTVLLKGVNADSDTLGALMRKLVKHRIKPYYLHHPDLVQGTEHFRLSLAEGEAIYQSLRGKYSGLCQLSYVIDLPGGYGKMPINASYYKELKPGHYEIKDYLGNLHFYEDI